MKSATDLPLPEADNWDLQEAVIIAFEAAWSRGESPQIRDFLPKSEPGRGHLLVELAHADIEFRIKTGEPARVEAYLAAYPELTLLPDVRADLIRTECRIRLPREVGLALDHYCVRFPDLAADLATLLPSLQSAPPVGHPGGTLGVVPAIAHSCLPRPLGKYELRQIVGQGNFGFVFRAWDGIIERDVAIKIPRPEVAASPLDMQNFLREARNAIHLRHPNIVAIQDAGPVDGTVCLVSEFIEGMTLAERLRIGLLGVAESVNLMVQVLEALAHAHRRGIVHRDLKPSNILLDRDGVPHLADFGLAKRSAGDSTLSPLGASHVLIGTPAYMAPEQVRGDTASVDARSDVYSAGALLFELLTGSVPFRGRGRLLQAQIEAACPVSPRQLNEEISPELETICLRALAKQPGDRYQSASAMGDDLVSFRVGQPILSRRIRSPVLASWKRRLRRVLLIVSALAGVSLVVLVGLDWWELRRQSSIDMMRIKRLVEDSLRVAASPSQGGQDSGEEHRRTTRLLWEQRRAWLEAIEGKQGLLDLRADVLIQSARHFASLGDDEAARHVWAEAITAVEPLACRQTSSRERRVDLARALAALAALEAQAGHHGVAGSLGSAASQAWSRLAGTARSELRLHPDSLTVRLDLAEAMLGQERAKRTTGQPSSADAVAKVEEVAADILEHEPHRTSDWARLGTIQLGLADDARWSRRPTRAAEWGRRAYRSFDSAKAGEEVSGRGVQLARSALLVGLIETDLGGPVASDPPLTPTALLRNAVDLLDLAIQTDPSDLDLHHDRANAEAGLASCLARSGRGDPAIQAYRRAMEGIRLLRRARPGSHSDLALEAEALAGLGRVEWARGSLCPASVHVILALCQAQRAIWLAPGEVRYREARNAQVAHLLRRLGDGYAAASDWGPHPAPGSRNVEVELH